MLHDRLQYVCCFFRIHVHVAARTTHLQQWAQLNTCMRVSASPYVFILPVTVCLLRLIASVACSMHMPSISRHSSDNATILDATKDSLCRAGCTRALLTLYRLELYSFAYQWTTSRVQGPRSASSPSSAIQDPMFEVSLR